MVHNPPDFWSRQFESGLSIAWSNVCPGLKIVLRVPFKAALVVFDTFFKVCYLEECKLMSPLSFMFYLFSVPEFRTKIVLTFFCLELLQLGSGHQSHSFKIRKPTGEIFHLACQSKEDLIGWLDNIQAAIVKQDKEVKLVTQYFCESQSSMLLFFYTFAALRCIYSSGSGMGETSPWIVTLTSCSTCVHR